MKLSLKSRRGWRIRELRRRKNISQKVLGQLEVALEWKSFIWSLKGEKVSPRSELGKSGIREQGKR
jgi:hypothetical protein